MVKYPIIVFCLLIAIPGLSQPEDKNIREIKEVITELMDGYRAGDSSRVAAVFSKDARMQSIYTSTSKESRITLPKSSDSFIKYIGNGLQEVHDERLWDSQIHADNQLATLWTKYAFYLGNKFTHCGTETFLLRKEDNQWKIFYVVDTRQTEGCHVPDELKK